MSHDSDNEFNDARYSDGRRIYSPTGSGFGIGGGAASVLISSAFPYGQSEPYQRPNTSSGYNANSHFNAIVSRIQNSQAPLEVHETDSVSVMVDGVLIRGIWVNKEDSVNWRPESSVDKRNPLALPAELSISTANAEIMKKTYLTSGELVQNVNIKFLKPPPPCVGDLIIGKFVH